MRPIKIDIGKMSREDFFDVLIRLFPVVADNPPEHQEKLWQFMSNYQVIVIDLLTGSFMHGLSNMGWVLDPEYINNVPTPQHLWDALGTDDRRALDDYLRKTTSKATPEPVAFVFDTAKMEEIIEKIGLEQATPAEMKYMEQCAEYLRKKDE